MARTFPHRSVAAPGVKLEGGCGSPVSAHMLSHRISTICDYVPRWFWGQGHYWNLELGLGWTVTVGRFMAGVFPVQHKMLPEGAGCIFWPLSMFSFSSPLGLAKKACRKERSDAPTSKSLNKLANQGDSNEPDSVGIPRGRKGICWYNACFFSFWLVLFLRDASFPFTIYSLFSILS